MTEQSLNNCRACGAQIGKSSAFISHDGVALITTHCSSESCGVSDTLSRPLKGLINSTASRPRGDASDGVVFSQDFPSATHGAGAFGERSA